MVSPIRFSGMASGMDTEKIIKDLMKVERIPIDRLKKKRQTEEWKRDAYREMNSLLLDLRNKLDGVRFASSLDKRVAVSSNDTYVSTKSVGMSNLSSYTVEVQSIGKTATPASASSTVTTPPASTTTAIGGSSFTIDIKYGPGAGDVKSITVDPTDSIDGIINKINAESSTTGVKATFFNNKITYTSINGSSSVNVTVTGANALGIAEGAQTSIPANPGEKTMVKINGVDHEIDGTTFTYDGVEFTVKQATTSPITVNVKRDTDAVFNAIKGFVDKYNEVIEKINAKISEKKVKGYEPLTDEEKEALPEKTAEKLEEMAKKGIISGDFMLKNGLNEMRRALYTKLTGPEVDPAFDIFSEIGITGAPNGKYAYQENGKLYIDETKLREAIDKNGDKVIRLFTQYAEKDDPDRYNKTGLAQRLYDAVNSLMKSVTDKAGDVLSVSDESVIGQSIKRIDEDIRIKEDRLRQVEDRYWKQFTAMEKAMQQANSQSGWFAQMMAQSR